MHRLLYVSGLSVIVALGGFLLGFDFSVIAGVNPFIKPYWNLSDLELGFTASVISFGTVFGTFSAGPAIDRWGRKKILLICAILYAISAVTSAIATDFVFFNIARIIGGVAIGASIITAPVYVAEISPPAFRGRLVGINQFTIVLGISVAYFSNYFLLGIGENNWRWMLGVEAFPALLYFFLLFFVPESPRWMAMKGMLKEAKETMLKFIDPVETEREMKDIQASISSREKPRYIELIASRVKPLFIIALILGACQQLSGVNAVFSYAPMIFAKAGEGSEAAFMSSVIVGLVNLVSTIFAIWLMDKIGRRPLLIFGAIGMTVSHITLALAAYFDHFEGILVLITILCFIASFAVSMGPGYWILVSEIMPNRLRGIGISVIQGVTNISAMAVVWLYPWAQESLGVSKTFFVFSLITGFTIFFLVKYIPETKGKSLEELEVELGVRG